MSFTNAIENALLDHLIGGPDYTRPATLYFAAFTAAPGEGGGGTEVSGGSYARVGVTNNPTNFPAASGGSKQNANAIEFPQATGSWGDVVALGVFDAASGGTLISWGTFTPKTIESGDTLRIDAGGFTQTLD